MPSFVAFDHVPTAASYASKARRIGWSRNYTAKDIEFGIEVRALMPKVWKSSQMR
ncbi:hypothetical protein COCNU_09G009160 [Cocos nucifera]|uniref:Uncharacterized protein n=1 Tax=Cocos nucifera TaxID=13894 RepID=A0A8K0IK69_COCNU|nr:hypothetical protein COCNU_09G009160 [Cocos nucifera]